MVKKYEQLKSFAAGGDRASTNPQVGSSYERVATFGADVALNQTPAHEDSTSRFLRELRERQAMAQDTKSIGAPTAASPWLNNENSTAYGNAAGLTVGANPDMGGGLHQDQGTKGQWLYF